MIIFSALMILVVLISLGVFIAYNNYLDNQKHIQRQSERESIAEAWFEDNGLKHLRKD